MSKRLIIPSSTPGAWTELVYDDSEGKHGSLIVNNVQDCEALIEDNKRDYTADKKPNHQLDGIGHRVACIPLTVWLDLRKRGIIGDRKKFRRWLNDADNRHFRTSDETV